MSAYKKVAIAGATGNLGPSIVTALVDAGFDVTVLTRSSKPTNLPSSVKTVVVDFTSQSSLTAALQGQDALISAVPNHGDQPALIDAAIAAGVKRFIPSEFGSDVVGNKHAAALPVFAGKLKTQEYLKQKQGEISHTVIVNGPFLDWGLMVGFIASPKGGKNTIYDGGEGVRSMTLLSHIGQAVVGVLRHPQETENRAVYIQSATVSQNRLLEFAKKRNPAAKFEIENVDTAELEKNCYSALGQEGADVGKAMVGFIIVSVFRDGYGSLFEKTDNELLGIKELSDAEVEEVVARYV